MIGGAKEREVIGGAKERQRRLVGSLGSQITEDVRMKVIAALVIEQAHADQQDRAAMEDTFAGGARSDVDLAAMFGTYRMSS